MPSHSITYFHICNTYQLLTLKISLETSSRFKSRLAFFSLKTTTNLMKTKATVTSATPERRQAVARRVTSISTLTTRRPETTTSLRNRTHTVTTKAKNTAPTATTMREEVRMIMIRMKAVDQRKLLEGRWSLQKECYDGLVNDSRLAMQKKSWSFSKYAKS